MEVNDENIDNLEEALKTRPDVPEHYQSPVEELMSTTSELLRDSLQQPSTHTYVTSAMT